MKEAIDYVLYYLMVLEIDILLLVFFGVILYSLIHALAKKELKKLMTISLSKIKKFITLALFLIPLLIVLAIVFKLLDAWDPFGIFYNLSIMCWAFLGLLLSIGIIIGLSYWHSLSWKSWVVFCLCLFGIILLFFYPTENQLYKIVNKRFERDLPQYLAYIQQVESGKIKPVEYHYSIPTSFPAIDIMQLYTQDSSLALAFYKSGNNSGAPGFRGYVYLANDKLDIKQSIMFNITWKIKEHWYWTY